MLSVGHNSNISFRNGPYEFRCKIYPIIPSYGICLNLKAAKQVYIRKIPDVDKVTVVKGDNPKFVLRVENTEFRVHCSCPNYLAVYHRNSYADVSKWHKQFECINFKGKVYKAIAMCVLHEWRCENWSYDENIRRYIKDSRKYYQQLNAINWANSCINYGEDCIIRHE